MKNVQTLSDDELIDLYVASMKHCANVVLTNVDGSDDAQDYTESAVDIMSTLQPAFRDDANDDNYVVLRDTFARIIPTAYDTYASDAIPSEWDAFIDSDNA